MKFRKNRLIITFFTTLLATNLHASERVFSDAAIEKMCRGLTFNDGFGRNISETSRLLNNDPEMGYYFLIGYPGSDEENAVGHVAIVTPNLYLNVFPEDESKRPQAKNLPLSEIEADVRIVLLMQCSREDLNKIDASIKALQARLAKKMVFSLGSLEVSCHKISYTFPHNFEVTNESFKEIIAKFSEAEGFKKLDVIGDSFGISRNKNFLVQLSLFLFQYSLDKPVFLRYALPKHTDQLICCSSAVLDSLGCHPGLRKLCENVDSTDLAMGYAQRVEIAKLTGKYSPLEGCAYRCELKSDLITDVCSAIMGSSLDSISRNSRNNFVESLTKIQDHAMAAYNRPADVGLQVASVFAGIGGALLGGIIGGPFLGGIAGGVAAGRSVNDSGHLTVEKTADKRIFIAKAENAGAMVRRFDDCYKALEKLIEESNKNFNSQFPDPVDREKILFAVFSRILLSQDTYCRPENFLSNLSKHDEGSHLTVYFARKEKGSQEWEINLSFFEKMQAADLEKFLEIQTLTLIGLKRGLKLNDEIFAQCLNDLKHALKKKVLKMRPSWRSTVEEAFGCLGPIKHQIELKNHHWGSAFKELVDHHKRDCDA